MKWRYAVDTDVLVLIQRAGHASSLKRLGALPVVITDMVWGELTSQAEKGKAPRRIIQEAEDLLRAIAGGPTEFPPEGLESQTLVALQRPPETEGLGEHSVIAYAYHHPEVVAILNDRRGLHRGIEELRGRTLSVHGVLDVLRTHHGLEPKIADEISSWYCKHFSPQRPPLWW